MKRYRKKPVTIEAVRVPEDASKCFSMTEWLHYGTASFDMVNDAVDGFCILIETPEGTMKARPGDWIIKGVAGEFYPCRHDIFEATYEAVDA